MKKKLDFLIPEFVKKKRRRYIVKSINKKRELLLKKLKHQISCVTCMHGFPVIFAYEIEGFLPDYIPDNLKITTYINIADAVSLACSNNIFVVNLYKSGVLILTIAIDIDIDRSYSIYSAQLPNLTTPIIVIGELKMKKNYFIVVYVFVFAFIVSVCFISKLVDESKFHLFINDFYFGMAFFGLFIFVIGSNIFLNSNSPISRWNLVITITLFTNLYILYDNLIVE